MHLLTYNHYRHIQYFRTCIWKSNRQSIKKRIMTFVSRESKLWVINYELCKTNLKLWDFDLEFRHFFHVQACKRLIFPQNADFSSAFFFCHRIKHKRGNSDFISISVVVVVVVFLTIAKLQYISQFKLLLSQLQIYIYNFLYCNSAFLSWNSDFIFHNCEIVNCDINSELQRKKVWIMR